MTSYVHFTDLFSNSSDGSSENYYYYESPVELSKQYV
jgi:hypothetical protein